MTQPDITGTDWVDPEEPPTEPATSTDIEAPEADAAEQSATLRPERDTRPTIGPEVDEYDAVEQSRVVDYDDEYRD
jgi:hypothetical protein